MCYTQLKWNTNGDHIGVECVWFLVMTHDDMTCLKFVVTEGKKQSVNTNYGVQQALRKAFRGVNAGPEFQFTKTTKQVFRHGSKKNEASMSGTKKIPEVTRDKIVTSNPFEVSTWLLMLMLRG